MIEVKRNEARFSSFGRGSSRPLAALLLQLLLLAPEAQSFLMKPAVQRITPTASRVPVSSSSSSLFMNNFFKDLMENAFANDPNLSQSDKKDGSIDEALYDDEYTTSSSSSVSTPTQEKWRQAQLRIQSTQRGAPIQPETLENTKFQLDLFLSGVPSKDPSNDLYGAKVNISSRQKETALDLPDEPSVSVQVQFLPNGVCQTSASSFTSGTTDGEWKLSDDGRMVRFSMDVLGYTRTIQTKGTITNVFWSDRDQPTTQTSTMYSIPSGWVYCDVSIGYGVKPGTLQMSAQKNDDGVLRVEQSVGLLGVASKLIPCGTFRATQILDEQ